MFSDRFRIRMHPITPLHGSPEGLPYISPEGLPYISPEGLPYISPKGCPTSAPQGLPYVSPEGLRSTAALKCCVTSALKGCDIGPEGLSDIDGGYSKYKTGNRKIHTRSTKCQYSPVYSIRFANCSGFDFHILAPGPMK